MMYNHETEDYPCPFCSLAQGKDDEINRQEFIVYQDAATIAFVSPTWWANNPGNVVIIPKAHYENLYDMPDALLGDVYSTTKKLAIAIRESYLAEGTSTRQHNEPAGNQDVWHFHVHVFPRYQGDALYKSHDTKEWISAERRSHYARILRAYFGD
jgi:histidine triad (HIT) family protein